MSESPDEVMKLLHKIDKDVVEIKVQILNIYASQEKLVTRAEFEPVQRIAYGLVATVLLSVITAVIALVLGG